MKINIKATGIELTPAISDYVHKKVSALEKFVGKDDVVAQVEVGKSTQHHKSGNIYRAEVHIVGAGHDNYAVSDKSDLYAAIDTVKDEIARELTHEKDKRFALVRKSGRFMKDVMRGFTSAAGKIRFRRR